MKKATTFIIALITNIFFTPVCVAQLSDALMLTVSSGQYSDQTAIRFLEDATSNFDSEYDAHKLNNRGLTPNLSSNLNELSYAINAVQGGGENIDFTVPLQLEVAFKGEYVLNAEEIGAFDSSCMIILIDRVARKKYNLRTTSSITIICDVDDPINRFDVIFKSSPSNSSKNQFANVTTSTQMSSSITQAVTIFDSEGKILIKVNQTQAPILVCISDLAGNNVANTTLNNGTEWGFSARQNQVYMVKVVVDGVTYTEKVFVQ